MSEQGTTRRDLMAEVQVGMARFFTPQNLDQYRKLAGEPMNSAERREVFKFLEEEMRALKSEMKNTP